MLTLSGAATATATTDSTGKYTLPVLANGTYVVAASHSGYTFTPPTVTVTVNGAAVTGVNFAAMPMQAPVPHSVTLSWALSTSSNIVGFYVYRGRTAGGPYAQIGFASETSYVDPNVSAGQTYFYVVTAVHSNNKESAYSTEAKATIPTP
jgi:fibronectin type 3 domain-containing protein